MLVNTEHCSLLCRLNCAQGYDVMTPGSTVPVASWMSLLSTKDKENSYHKYNQERQGEGGIGDESEEVTIGISRCCGIAHHLLQLDLPGVRLMEHDITTLTLKM